MNSEPPQAAIINTVMDSQHWLLRTAVALAVALAAGGCASSPEEVEEGFTDPYDPLETTNRYIYDFNYAIDRVTLKPAAEVYDAFTPDPVQTCFSNVRNNLAEPIRAVGHAVGGNFQEGYLSSFRFVFNTFLGGLGCMDPAEDGLGVDGRDSDIGLALRSYNDTDPDEQLFFMVPLLGPSTPLDSIGSVGDHYADPRYIGTLENPYRLYEDACLCYDAMYYIVTRHDLLPVTELIEETALDPYLFVRDAYLESRAARAEEIRETRAAIWSR